MIFRSIVPSLEHVARGRVRVRVTGAVEGRGRGRGRGDGEGGDKDGESVLGGVAESESEDVDSPLCTSSPICCVSGGSILTFLFSVSAS